MLVGSSQWYISYPEWSIGCPLMACFHIRNGQWSMRNGASRQSSEFWKNSANRIWPRVFWRVFGCFDRVPKMIVWGLYLKKWRKESFQSSLECSAVIAVTEKSTEFGSRVVVLFFIT